jgi:acyl-CoA reductase-like NAD-dependent aldehyde dehydrogenase
MLAAGIVREAAAMTTQIGGEVIPSDKPGCIAMALREPVGVILGIAPWNAPIILGVRAIAMPLACGNTVVLKASEQCPRTHALIVGAFVGSWPARGRRELVTNAPHDAAEIVGTLIDHRRYGGSTLPDRPRSAKSSPSVPPSTSSRCYSNRVARRR